MPLLKIRFDIFCTDQIYFQGLMSNKAVRNTISSDFNLDKKHKINDFILLYSNYI